MREACKAVLGRRRHSRLGFEREELFGSMRLRINQDARIEHALRI
jgi:hypothetical protein